MGGAGDMRILVMGAGGVGGYFGGVLARAGLDVTFVARGAHLEAMRREGLTVQRVAGDFRVEAKAVEWPGEAAPADLVLFAVKSYDTEPAARVLASSLGAEGSVLCLQNGVDNEEVLGGILGRNRILPGSAYIESTIRSPGVIAQTAGPCRIVFGEWDGRPSPRVEAVEQLFRRAGIDVEVAADVMAAKWRKYLFMCSFGGLNTLTGCPMGALLQDPESRRVFRTLMEEVVLVARARGVHLEEGVVEERFRFLETFGSEVQSSMRRDFERGKPLELEALVGHLVREGARLGVPTPANGVVYGCLKVMAERR